MTNPFFAPVIGQNSEVTDGLHAPNRSTVYERLPEIMRVMDNGVPVPYDPERAPYMKEPCNTIQSRVKQAVIMMGTARSSKTCSLILGCIAKTVVDDPCDMLLLHITRDKARIFSRQELDRLMRFSPALAEKLSSVASDNNIHEKFFKDGSMLNILWPSNNNMAASTYKRVLITDHDRAPLDVSGEGSYFLQALKRIQTLQSAGMAVCESSPGFMVDNPNYVVVNAHEAPPAPGIASLYNQGDRRLYYWQCPECHFAFAPDFPNFVYDRKADTATQAAKEVYLPCPNCKHKFFDSDKRQLNLAGRWVPDGMIWEPSGELTGEARLSPWASFWQLGPIACDQSWNEMVWKYHSAMQVFERTGEMEDLKTTINTDQGKPFVVPRRLSVDAQSLRDRPRPNLWREVPTWARFLTAAVDVQGGKRRRFEVMVQAWGVDLESQTIDYFTITQTEDGEPIQPHAMVEHWNELSKQVLEKRYPLADNPNRFLSPYRMMVDTGGESGVSDNAYQYYRRNRFAYPKQIVLVKGSSRLDAPRYSVHYPESSPNPQRRKKIRAHGDVPILFLNTHQIKDTVFGALNRETPGPRYWHFPKALDDEFFTQLLAENRNSDGRWEKPSGAANEALDLIVYQWGGVYLLKADKINWERPPAYAMPLESNSYVTDGNEEVVRKPKRRRRART